MCNLRLTRKWRNDRDRNEPACESFFGVMAQVNRFPQLLKLLRNCGRAYQMNGNDITGGLIPASFEPSIDYVVITATFR